MRQQIIKVTGILCMTILFAACGRADQMSMEDDTLQLIEVSDETNQLIRQEADNIIITQLYKSEEMDKWKSIGSISEEATKCYTYTSYALVTDTYWKESNTPQIVVANETLYQFGKEYYIEESGADTEQGIKECYQIPENAGIAMLRFASKESDIQDKEKLFASWGVTDYQMIDGVNPAEEDIEEDYNLSEEDTTEQSENVLGFMTPISSKDLEKVSREQKVEISYRDTKDITISDLEEIANLYNGLLTDQWVEVSQFPDATEKICTMKFYQLERKKVLKELIESNVMCLYKADGKYYIVDEIALPMEGESENINTYYEIPQQAMEYVRGLR